jgi:uncharacterized protein YecE (DUF72 family)
MQFLVGTSGYSYKEWKGSFYPEKLPQKEMLEYYSQRFSTVEINNSFYRMPAASVVESWAQQTPKSFRFVLKAPQTITHRKRLNDCAEQVDELLQTAAVLKSQQGPLLFQLPPNFKKDLARLDGFLSIVDNRTPITFEFRHESWFDDEVFDCLRAHSCALCVADAEDLPPVKLFSTTDWGYVRLRREEYSDKDLRHWIKNIKAQDWNRVYVFFKHEDTGTGPKFATRFLELVGAAS